VRAESATADVRLEMLAAPQTLDVETTVGDVDLAVPADTAYRADARSVSGDERVLVPTDPATSRTIQVVGEAGDLRIHPSR
jgi:hypothetical protein